MKCETCGTFKVDGRCRCRQPVTSQPRSVIAIERHPVSARGVVLQSERPRSYRIIRITSIRTDGANVKPTCRCGASYGTCSHLTIRRGRPESPDGYAPVHRGYVASARVV